MSDQVKFTSKLAGKRILIIGGSAGIGYGVAEGSLESGATVIISSSNPSRVSEAVSSLQKSYPSAKDRISGHAASMGDEATLEQNVIDLLEKAGKDLDHIVYTAGDSLAMLKIGEASFAQIKQAGMVRFFAPTLVAKHAPKYLKSSTASSIVLTTGSVSERPRPDWTIVGSFATGLQGLTRGLALDLKPIRVNLVSPGAIETPLWDGIPEPQRKEMFKTMGAKMVTGRIGQVEDVAEAYLYLMKDGNVTGSMVSSNGGAMLL